MATRKRRSTRKKKTDAIQDFPQKDDQLTGGAPEAPQDGGAEAQEAPVQPAEEPTVAPEPAVEAEAPAVEEPVVVAPEEPCEAPAPVPGNDAELRGPLANFAEQINQLSRRFFPNSVLNNYSADDLIFMARQADQKHRLIRANNSPGCGPQKEEALARLQELRAILRILGA